MKARPRYHHGDLKAALVAAALTLIEENGAPTFTMREVAERLGVTHPATYRHFEDKRALLAEIATQGYGILDAMVTPRLRAGRSRGAKLVAFARAYVAFASTHEAYFRVMFGPRLNRDHRFPELGIAVRRAYARLFEAMGGAGDPLASRSGKGRAAHDRAFASWALVQGYASLLCDGRIPLASRAAAGAHVTRLAKLLAAGIG